MPTVTFRIGVAAALLCAFATAARAHVLEIGDEGSVTVYDRPAVFSDDVVRPIAPSVIVTPAIVRGAPDHEIARHISDAAAVYALDRGLLESVAWRESRFRQTAVSPKGAAGVMQLMPGTARDLGVDSADARQNVFGGAAYLKAMLGRFGGDVRLALAAYNAGPGAVLKYGGVPPFSETRAYVTAVVGRATARTDQAAVSGAAVSLN